MPTKNTPAYHLSIAERHLDKVRAAWDDPTDWADLTTYGLYCVEALVHAAGVAVGLSTVKTHWQKVGMAETLHTHHGLTDVSGLMRDLNEGRKANAYGDSEFDNSDLDAEEIANAIEEFFDEVGEFVASQGREDT